MRDIMRKAVLALLLALYAVHALTPEQTAGYFENDYREDLVMQAYQEALNEQNAMFQDVQRIISNIYGTGQGIIQNPMGKCPITQMSTTPITEVIGPSLIAIVIVMLIALIYYMLGKALGNPLRGAHWVVFDEGITTAIVVLIFFTLNSLFYQGGTSPFLKVAGVYLVSVIRELGISLSWLAFLNFIWWNIYTYQLPVPLTPTWDISLSFYIGQTIKPLIDATGFITMTVNNFLGLFMGQLVLLCFTPVFVYGIAMPIGILLRAFSITRGAGNFLIAMSFAFMFIYPLFLNLAYIIYKADYLVFSKNTVGFPEIIRDGAIKSLTVGAIFLGISYISRILTFVLGGQTEQANAIASAILSNLLIISTIAIFNYLYLAVFKLANTIFVLGLFVPALTAYVVLASAMEFSERLGTRFDFSTFLRII